MLTKTKKQRIRKTAGRGKKITGGIFGRKFSCRTRLHLFKYTVSAAYASNSNGDISAFIGAKTEYYIPKFNQIKAQNKKSSWNWCSFLFAPYWFIYKKMYGYGAATLGGMFLLNLIGGWFLSLLSLAAYIVFGIMGNYIYMQQIEKHTAQYNMLTEPMKSQYLSKNSGTNTTATVLTIIGYAILIGIIQAV